MRSSESEGRPVDAGPVRLGSNENVGVHLHDGDVPILALTRPEHAYLFGFLQTDGHHSASTRRRGRVSIELQIRDRAVLEAFGRLLPVRSTLVDRTRTANFAVGYRSSVWSVHDAAFRTELTALGLPPGRKSATTAPPVVELSAPDYVRGLLDGDGSIGFTSRGYPFVSFTTASGAMAEFFCAQVLEVTGARRTVNRNRRDGVFNPMITSGPAAVLAAWAYPPGCLALDRKKRAAEAVASWVRPATMRRRSTSQRWTREQDEVLLATPDNLLAAERLGRTEKSVQMRRWRSRAVV